MKAERKYLAHYLDGAFDTTYAATNYVRLGKDLEEAFVLSDFVEHAAYVAYMAKVVGKPIELTMDNLLDPDLEL